MDQAIQSLYGVQFGSSEKANTTGEVSFQGETLVSLTRPTIDVLEKKQLGYLRAAADLRYDRLSEIRVETSNIQSFFASVSYMSSAATKWQLALTQAVFRLCTHIEMPVKLGFDVPRPITLAYQVQPIIQTPGHGAWPSGHATESFAAATLLSRLCYNESEPLVPRDLIAKQTPFYRQAERIAINRTVAGVHYPTDSMAGAVLGVSMAEALVNLLDGREETTARSFDGSAYAGDFNLAVMSEEIGKDSGVIRETTIKIDPSVVPDWLRKMWQKALIGG
ncbi:phosphatase PAP2 family protein [Salipiger bermudensis]|uniref:phosphatase PAP2 family protein n=1 Tax=Salipiger bermudensis TaxID=344736 RepID=UPI001C99E632|nr:phosphatase PAP2 family protein [Salipiger bermudensis]MBY6004847.1 phosphatase PAP2 family protein [Salipiger bermudensis]